MPLKAYAFPGGYTINYLTGTNDILCHDCAEQAVANGEIVTGFIHWEGESLYCDDCHAELESEYGNPWEDDY